MIITVGGFEVPERPALDQSAVFCNAQKHKGEYNPIDGGCDQFAPHAKIVPHNAPGQLFAPAVKIVEEGCVSVIPCGNFRFIWERIDRTRHGFSTSFR